MNTNSIALIYGPKDPADTRDYPVSFANMLTDNAPATIASLEWSIVAPDGDVTPMTIVSPVGPVAGPADSSTVRLAAGTLGNTYAVRCTLTMSDGQLITQSFSIEAQFT